MTTIYLVRHGEYENPEYLFPGRSDDFPLSETGKAQVAKLAGFFADKGIRAIYSSPVLRTRQTAEQLGEALHLGVNYDERLQEVRTGLEGSSMADLDAVAGNVYTPKLYEAGAESIEDIVKRMDASIQDIRRVHKGKSVAVVTHGDPLRFVVMQYTGMPLDFGISRSVATPLAGGYMVVFAPDGAVTSQPIVLP